MTALPRELSLFSLTAADVMTPDVFSVVEGDSLAAAWEILARSRFHHLPVMRGSSCVGVIDDRAVVRSFPPGSMGRIRRRVGDVLPRRVLAVDPAATLPEVARRLRDSDVDGLPVVDDRGRFLGIVTTTDLIEALTTVTC